MLLDCGFTALLLLITAVSAQTVPPPTNVTVSCQNLQITVHWEYSRQEPQTKFRVNILSSGNNREYVSEITDGRQYDLSNFIWKSEKRYMDYNYVNVTAIQGDYQSVPVFKSFTYNDLKTVHIKCKLDFPPVNLTVKDSKARVRFENPLYYYEKLNKAATKQGEPAFRFDVSLNGIDFDDQKCRNEDHICKQELLPTKGVNCVKLKGKLFDRNGIINFRETEQICASDEAELDVYVLTLIILLVIFVLIIIVIALFICKEKAYTLTDGLPKPLEWPPEHRPIMFPPSERDPSVLEVMIDPRPKRCSSVSSEEIDPCGSLQGDSSASSDLQPPSRCLYMEGRHLDSGNEILGAAGMSEGHGTDDDSVKTECLSLHSEEEERSAYDCPHAHVDMGEGDIVFCYNK